MTPEKFCIWLQGLFELGDPKSLNKKQTKLIKKHLELVFHCVTRDENDQPVEEIKFPPFLDRPDVNWDEWIQTKELDCLPDLSKTCSTFGQRIGGVQSFC